MAWLKVDDRMAEHRKVLALRRADRWTWMELLLYVARQNNGGHVPAGVTDVLRHVNDGFLERCQNAGLLDTEDETGLLVVHDWDVYNPKDPTAADRMRRYRKRNNDA